MATLTPNQYVRVWADGLSDRSVLYALRKATAADTADLSADFSIVKQAIIVGTTVIGTATVTSINGTVVTIPAGLSNDGGWLLVWGVSA